VGLRVGPGRRLLRGADGERSQVGPREVHAVAGRDGRVESLDLCGAKNYASGPTHRKFIMTTTWLKP